MWKRLAYGAFRADMAQAQQALEQAFECKMIGRESSYIGDYVKSDVGGGTECKLQFNEDPVSGYIISPEYSDHDILIEIIVLSESELQRAKSAICSIEMPLDLLVESRWFEGD